MYDSPRMRMKLSRLARRPDVTAGHSDGDLGS
jgi:hypothetical protein